MDIYLCISLFLSVLSFMTIIILLRAWSESICFLFNRYYMIAVLIVFTYVNFLMMNQLNLFIRGVVIVNLLFFFILFSLNVYLQVILLKRKVPENSFLSNMKNYLISGTVFYFIISVILNAMVLEVVKSFYSCDMKALPVIILFALFVIELINIISILLIIKLLYVPKVTIWGENLTKYEGWLLQENKNFLLIKDKYSNKLISIKRDNINQIVLEEKQIK